MTGVRGPVHHAHRCSDLTLRVLLSRRHCIMATDGSIRTISTPAEVVVPLFCNRVITYFDHGTSPFCHSVSRETIRSKKRSDYNLNKTNAPILTNTTLNVIRLVGESLFCPWISKEVPRCPWDIT